MDENWSQRTVHTEVKLLMLALSGCEADVETLSGKYFDIKGNRSQKSVFVVFLFPIYSCFFNQIEKWAKMIVQFG